MRKHTHTHTHTQTLTHTHTYKHTHRHTHILTHTYINTHTHKYTHTHTHTHTLKNTKNSQNMRSKNTSIHMNLHPNRKKHIRLIHPTNYMYTCIKRDTLKVHSHSNLMFHSRRQKLFVVKIIELKL